MSVFDINSNYEFIMNESFFIDFGGLDFGGPFMINDSNSGFTTTIFLASGLGGATITITLQESKDANDWVDIPVNKLISSIGATTLVVDSDQVPPAEMPLLGAISTDKFIRPKIFTDNVGPPLLFDFNVWKKADKSPQSRIIP